jgi:hypothetical protein
MNILEKIDKFIIEKIELDIEIGDTILGGRFKNKRTIVKTIERNEKGDILINGSKTLLKFRIPKMVKSDTPADTGEEE